MISARPSAVVTYMVLAFCAAVVARSMRFGLACATLHLASVLVHHAGHALAAKTVGHPMSGIRLWGGLASSVYPDDEPLVPAWIHVTRAIGGPLTSLSIGAVVAICVPRGGHLRKLVIADNVFVLGLGSLLPLGFTDGSTLLEALR